MSTLATARALATALAAALNSELAGAYPDLGAATAWTVTAELSDLTQPLVNVNPISWTTNRQARGAWLDTIEIELGALQALTAPAGPDTETQLGEFLDLVEALAQLFQLDQNGQPGPLQRGALAGCEFLKIEQPEILNGEALANRLALSTLVLTYNAQPEET